MNHLVHFSKALMLHYHIPNFMFLIYLYPEIWAAGKNDLQGIQTLNRKGLLGLITRNDNYLGVTLDVIRNPLPLIKIFSLIECE